ncbi:Flavin-dependent tryptophan halogenase RebH [Asticcacaulis sp. MM231]|uniref:tryptophan halogenase family protein n=1 Tax=Asticcacaulis sp. MM231 TaxID=3157666 RepID=UPI0032D57463
MAEPKRVRKVVVLGRDESLWLAVNTLERAFSKADIEITAIELPSLLRAGDVYPTLRAQEAFHSLMGLKEDALMRASQATFSLGQRFSNWAKTRPPFFHAYSTYGAKFERVQFHHYWLKARANGLKAEFDDFSLSVAAAKHGRFFVPNEETDSFSNNDYAYHLGAVGYCQILKQVALQRGVIHRTGRLAEALRAENGDITGLLLNDGQVVEGDFFIDASGAESLLLGQAMGVGLESWSQWFACDRILTTYAPPLAPLPSFSQASAFRSGWLGLYPLRDRTAVQQVYASVDMGEQEAFDTAGIVSALKLHGDAVVTPYSAGCRTQFWAGNCLAVGEAAVVFDPIDNVRLHANLVGMSHLISLFPIDSDMTLERDEYNRNVTAAFERIRDFQICRYKLNQRFDQPMWDHSRAMILPDKLQYKLDVFEARGMLIAYDDETFEDPEWIAMLIGHGLIPKTYDPLVDQVNEGEVIRRFQQMLGFIRHSVEKMGPMEQHLGLSPIAAMSAQG